MSDAAVKRQRQTGIALLVQRHGSMLGPVEQPAADALPAISRVHPAIQAVWSASSIAASSTAQGGTSLASIGRQLRVPTLLRCEK
jgi:hypothetical protein